MGATVTCDKKIAAFLAPTGAIFYLAFEETYEKNCYPHTPHWGCIAFGSYPYVLKRIFGHASACEGGDLQTRKGHTSPENYLKGWFRAFQNPVNFDVNEVFDLKIESHWRSTFPNEAWPAAKDKLLAINRLDLVARISKPNGFIQLSLSTDLEVLHALYGEDGAIPPGRIFKHHRCFTLGDEALRPAQRQNAYTHPQSQFYRTDENNILMRTNDGQWHNAGWQYSIIGDFINEVAYHAEIACSNSSLALITQYREQVRRAPFVPEGTKVHIDIFANYVQQWNVDQAKEILQLLHHDANKHTFTVEYLAVDIDIRRKIFYLDNRQLQWEIPMNNEALCSAPQPILQQELFS